ncbi:MAG: cupin domain-containing protein [Caldilineaceae bacterium]|jgi:mannose-6-phosphate isomerase-like protein (cupin superfamily)|nr:cupin domain-containing protein [Caldilineaceae bacterium]
MMELDTLQAGQINVFSYRNVHARDVQLVRLFAGEELHAYLLVVPPGGAIESHVHENKHELFDVLEGEGIIEVDGRPIVSAPGRCIFVPAGSTHRLHNESETLWTLRITCQERVYPRHLGKLIGRAIRKRMTRWIG